VHILVGYPAGGPTDLFTRLIAQRLSERLDQPFIIENRPGAGSNVATEAVVRAPADGHTLLTVSISNALNVTLYDHLNFDFLRDIAPIAGINRAPGVMEVNLAFPAKTVLEFIAYAKANPGKINYGSGGSGSVSHLYGELFKAMTGVNLVHVPYRGAAPALVDLLGGQVQVMFDSVSTSIEHLKAGKLRPLAVTTATRLEALPNVPPMGDFVAGYVASGWNGIGAPKNTPTEIIEKLNSEINAVLGEPGIMSRFSDLNQERFSLTAIDFRRFMAVETEKWGQVIRAANIKAE
jgi:tripartite-type tricarboxylate transporter receptor subunit TctC